MTESPNLADATSEELQRRNLAFADKLEPIAEQLHNLTSERAELVRLGQAAEQVAEAAAGTAWIADREDRFYIESGRDAVATALAAVRDAVDELDMPAGAAQALDRPTVTAPWTPIRAGASDQEMHAAISRLELAGLDSEAATVREALIAAHHATGDLFSTAGRAFPVNGENYAEEEARVRASLAEIALTMEIIAGETRRALARRSA